MQQRNQVEEQSLGHPMEHISPNM